MLRCIDTRVPRSECNTQQQHRLSVIGFVKVVIGNVPYHYLPVSYLPWEALAAAFEASGQKKLAQDIKQFVNAMPPALTERELFLAKARKLIDKQQIQDCGHSR